MAGLSLVFIMQSMGDNINSAHYGIYGLSNCSESNCTSQIIETVLSAIIILWIVIELAMQIKVRIRLDFSWQQVMLIQIFMCLSFNICYMAWSNIILWYVLSCLMNQFYFTTLVYYFSKKYIEKSINELDRKPYLVTILIIYAIFCLSELGTFVYMVNSDHGSCKEIAQLIISGVMITLGVLFFVLAYQNEAQEKKKFSDNKVPEKVNSPLFTIWIWVMANILGQIINEIENGLIYSTYGGQQCSPIKNSLQTQILGPIFMILGDVIPFISTLIFYRQKRVQVEQRHSAMAQLELAAQVDVENRIELVHESTQGTGSSNRTMGII